MLHQLGRFYGPRASSLNRDRDGSIPAVGQVVEQDVFDRIGFVVMEIRQREKEKEMSGARGDRKQFNCERKGLGYDIEREKK